jgi:hypothetical protein
MNEQMSSVAVKALVKSFYDDFSALVNTYLQAAGGLDKQFVKVRLHEEANVYLRDKDPSGDAHLNLYSQDAEGWTYGHEDVLGAMSARGAVEVHVGCVKLVKDGGEWRIEE